MSLSTQLASSPSPTPPFHCVGCGACCKGRFIPLTLAEAQQWLKRGHEVAVLLEAFEVSTWPQAPQAYAYNVQRSAPVRCGEQTLQVTAILAGQAIPRCPNLGGDDRCGIYAERPLVCRIYPMEINPFIALRISDKECPPESWAAPATLATDRAEEREVLANIERSRQADRADAARKIALCQDLGLTTAAWKGNGLAIYFPLRDALLQAIERLPASASPRLGGDWQVRVVDTALRERLSGLPLAFDEGEPLNYLFHPVSA